MIANLNTMFISIKRIDDLITGSLKRILIKTLMKSRDNLENFENLRKKKSELKMKRTF